MLAALLAWATLRAVWAPWTAAPAASAAPGAAADTAPAPRVRAVAPAGLPAGPGRSGSAAGRRAAHRTLREGALFWAAPAGLPPAREFSAASGYSLLPPGQTCSDVGLDDPLDSTECFVTAAPEVAVDTNSTYVFSGPNGGIRCVYDVLLDMLVFAETQSAYTYGNDQYRFICRGIYTTTITTGTTALASSSATTTSYQDYTLLPPGQTCYEAGMQDVTEHAECFGPAMVLLNLSSATTEDYTGEFMSFTCVYVGSKSTIRFGDSTSETAVANPNYQYICIGVLTSTASSSTTRSSSATSSTTVTRASATSSLTSLSATTFSSVNYALLPAGLTCSQAGMRDITSSAECFGLARAVVGFGNAHTSDYTGLHVAFTCVHHVPSSKVYFGSSSDTAEAHADYEYICIGVLTTTASSSTTRTRSSTATSMSASSTSDSSTSNTSTTFTSSTASSSTSATSTTTDSSTSGTSTTTRSTTSATSSTSATSTTATTSSTRSITSTASSTTTTSTTGSSSTTHSTTTATSSTTTTGTSRTTRSTTSATSSTSVTSTTGTSNTTRSTTSATSSSTHRDHHDNHLHAQQQ
ncbi:unnamed protein product [Prorocentrum cordatum]|uniref:Subtilisin n=1 Tax=Prorocentrum cordatum TaxID=2364126 RepID=A0ABN9U483_9DINO|nr:unnamed protein product [Polarella glacialis]